ncbi:ADP-ribosyltransferase [Streptomonospora litoralis]|uniref:ADP-ribosyltransferase exoenzyme n=1 Tax=Streptomonospora litoralis TaxID=2498135 RepID=A0A4P6PX21_9ACTN|nr:ADP-ribosyltransferase [Streptomonospora litoralis]QBI52220.1 ADP-ribosyltransferase exoenzyme [Streptomonospora litoralis]
MTEKVISPEDVPVPQVDCDAVETAGQNLKSDGTDVAQAGQDIKTSWHRLEGVYAAPEAATLFASINPVATNGDDFDTAATAAGNALITFAEEVRPIKARLKALKADAADFQSTIAGDDDWREDEDKINELDALNNDVLQAVFEYQRAERDCANTITALFGGTTFVATEPGGDASPGPNEEAHGTTEALSGVATPWATPQEHDKPWYVDVYDGAKDTVVGTVEDLGAMVGLHGEDGWGVSSLSDWGNNLKENWGATLNGLGSLVGFYGEDGWGVSSFSEWAGNAGAGWTEFAHAIVPWREWGDRPGYVITQGVINVGSMFLGGAGVVKALAKGSRKVGGGDGADAPKGDADAPSDLDLQQVRDFGDRPGQQTTRDLQNRLDDMDLDRQQLDGLQGSLDDSADLAERTTPVGGPNDPVDGDPASNNGSNGGQQQYTGGGSGGDGGSGGSGGHDGSNGSGAPDGSGKPVSPDGGGSDGHGDQQGDGSDGNGNGEGAPNGDGIPKGGPVPDGGGTSDGDAPEGDGTPGDTEPVALEDLTTTERMDRAEEIISEGARTFEDNSEATRYGQDHWNDYVDNLPADQKESLYNYTTEPPQSHPTYVEMNGQLRRGETLDPDVADDIANIDKAMAGRPIPEDVVVTRGTGLGHIKVHPADMPSVAEGFPDPGYMSTSLGGPAGGFASAEAILHLRVPAGTPALWVERISQFGGGERELLLGRGMTYTAVDSVFSNGQWHVYGTVTPPK